MADPKEAVLKEYLEHLEVLNREVAETRSLINSLRRRLGQEPMFRDEEGAKPNRTGSRIRSDQFFGRPLATAVREYLEFHGQAATAQEILAALEQGGFDLDATGWRKTDRIRSLSISLAKNTKTFVKLPSGTFGLRTAYPNLPEPKKAEAEGEGE